MSSPHIWFCFCLGGLNLCCCVKFKHLYISRIQVESVDKCHDPRFGFVFAWESPHPLTWLRWPGKQCSLNFSDLAEKFSCKMTSLSQGGKSWQPFGEGKNGHKSLVRRVFAIFATNASFLLIIAQIRYNKQYVPCYSALLAQETLFLTQKSTFFLPKDFQTVRKWRQWY